MATSSEYDLRDGDDSLIRLISDFTRSNADRNRASSDGRSWAPLVLAGFDDVQLRACFRADGQQLVWVVDVGLGKLGKRTELRYTMNIEDLGDVRQDWLRCTQRLRTFAEVHLRADLHLLQGGYIPAGGRSVTHIDARGWSERN